MVGNGGNDMPFITETPIRGALCIECWEEDQKRIHAVVSLNGHDLCKIHAEKFEGKNIE